MPVYEIFRRGEVIGTIEAETKRDAQIIVAERLGDGPWVRTKP